MRLLSRLSALPASDDLQGEFRAGWHRLEILGQSIYDTTDGRAVGTEALLRWRRNDRELWAAAMVLPLAEESGRIEEFTGWATELALTVWSSSRHRRSGSRIALNLHGTQLARRRLADELALTARYLDVEPDELILEIPDHLGPDRGRAAVEALGPLLDAGARVALDDHRGPASTTRPETGWLPGDSIVKLDPDLVFAADEPAGADVLQRVADELHAAGYVTVAEAVERPDQLAAVIRCGIPYAQGYLFGKPHPLV